MRAGRLETCVLVGTCARRGARLAGAGLIATLAWALPVADAGAQTVGLGLVQTSVSEGAGSADVTVTATLSSSQSGSTTVTLSLAGTATSADYTVAGSLPGRIPDFPVTRSHPPASWPSAANSSICRTYRKTAGEESRRRSPVANRWMRP